MTKHAPICPFCGYLAPLPAVRLSTFCARCSRLINTLPTTKLNGRAARLLPLHGVDSLELIRSARPGSTLPKAPNLGGGRLKHHIDGRQVICFGCSRTIRVSPHIKTANCPHCHTRVDLADHHIRTQMSGAFRTLGNITIHPGAAYVGPLLCCSNLTVLGTLNGGAHCTGSLHLRSSGTVTGVVECAHLLIDRSTKLRFLNQVRTHSAEIHGQAEGEIHCSGSIVVSRHGSLAGELVAADLQVDPGGTVLAETTIRRD